MAGAVPQVQTLAFNATDGGAPSSFAVALSVPLSPVLSGLLDVSLSLTASCTDGGTDGCSAAAFLSSNAVVEYFVNGFATSVGTLGTTPLSSATPGGDFGGPFSASSTFDCGGGCTGFETLISFTGSGGGDGYSFTSRFELDQAAVPAPSTLLLCVLGLGGLAVAYRRR